MTHDVKYLFNNKHCISEDPSPMYWRAGTSRSRQTRIRVCPRAAEAAASAALGNEPAVLAELSVFFFFCPPVKRAAQRPLVGASSYKISTHENKTAQIYSQKVRK